MEKPKKSEIRKQGVKRIIYNALITGALSGAICIFAHKNGASPEELWAVCIIAAIVFFAFSLRAIYHILTGKKTMEEVWLDRVLTRRKICETDGKE